LQQQENRQIVWINQETFFATVAQPGEQFRMAAGYCFDDMVKQRRENKNRQWR
jgi:hypothetical protein